MTEQWLTIRRRSHEKATILGYPINPNLPLLTNVGTLRDSGEIVARALSLYAVASLVVGEFPASIISKWTNNESLFSALTPSESRAINGEKMSHAERTEYADQIESIWTFGWVLGKVESLDHSVFAGNELGGLLPDIEANERSSAFRANLQIRSESEIMEASDLAYCLHWAVVDAVLNNHKVPGAVDPYVIVYRRKALEWVISRDDWDDVCLDT